MKKILIIVLALALLFSVAACQKEEATTEPTETKEAATEAVDEGGLEAAATNYFAEYPGSRIVPWDDVLALVEAGEEPFILSIRKADDYNAGHVEGAYNAAWGTDLAEKVSMLPTDEKVYVYCYSGQTAGQTIALLNMMGVDAVSVKSGFNALKKMEGYEDYLSTDAAELADAGASFDKEVLAYVQDYFNAIPDSGSNIIPSDKAAPLFESGDVTLVDIRKAEDFETGHIEGAVNIPFGENMQESFADLEGKIIVTCYSGQTAGQTVAVMRALGYDASSLKSGMMFGWGPYQKSLAANAYFADYPGSRIIAWTDLAAKIDAGEEPFILSIRKADDYNAGHVKGAYNAAWGADLAEKAAMLPTDETVYVYCYSGQTAGQTVALLNMMGVEAISVKSGYNFGISATDGYEAYVDTEAVELPDAGAEFNPVLLNQVKAYFAAIPESGSNIMPAADVLAAVEAGEVTVVDIRKAEDFAAGHIEGAVNVPFGANMQEKFAELPEGKLVVACYSGQTAGQTVGVLRMLDYDAVSLKSGMKGWVDADGNALATVTE